MDTLLSIDSVSKHFGDYKALNNVSVDIPKGSIFGLLGPNGAGKTTLIRIINQISIPDTGKVIFKGENLSQKHI
ncbi:MAG: ATP-binding cassette domain-containing protein, partial [Flavobacteriales bacterium]